MAGAAKPSMDLYLQEQAFDIGLDSQEGGRGFKTFLQGRPKNGDHVRLGGGMRLSAFVGLRYGKPLAPEYSLVAFEMETRGEDRLEGCIYANLLWRIGEDFPEYVCLGGTYVSQDGEYRKNLTWWKTFQETYAEESLTEDALPLELRPQEQIERRTHAMIGEGDLSLKLFVFSRAPGETQRLSTRCDELRLLVKLFVAQMICGADSLMPPHTQPMYTAAMEAPRKFMTEALDLIEKQPDPTSEDRVLAHRLGVELRKKFLCGARFSRLSCSGQKLIPLMRAEATQPGNTRYPGWREIWVAQRVSDLVINGRAGGFPLFNQWSIVGKVDEHMFDNDAMRRHFRTSEAATAALEQLALARRLALEGSDRGFASRLEDLDLAILRGASHAEQLILAPFALVSIVQHVGHTMGSLPHMPRMYPGVQGDKFETVLFDLLYNCLVMHSVGIHADLHYHNMTLSNRWGRQAYNPDHTCAVFVAGPNGEKDTFVVPTHGSTGCIIDFSRVIINPAQRKVLEAHQGVEQTDAFFREQSTRMLMALARWEPGFAKENQEKIKGKAFLAQQELYDVLTALDYLAIGRNIGLLMKEARGTECAWEISEKVIAKCDEIQEVAHEELLRGLRTVVIGKGKARAPTDEPIGMRILRRTFGHYLYAKWDPGVLHKYVLVDAFNATAPMKYSGESMDSFPPWAQVENLMKFAEGRPVESVVNRDVRAIQHMFEERVDGLDPEIELLVDKERAKLSKPSPAASKSWVQ